MGIQKPFQILSVPVLRQYLMLQFQELQDKMPPNLPYDFERCVDDFVFMCFFVGNDFLPHLPSLSIRDGSIDQMLSLYTEILPSLDLYLTDCGVVNLVQVEQFLEYLGGIEDQVFKNRLEREAKRRSELEEMRSREESQQASLPPVEAGGQMGGDLAADGPPQRRAPAAAAKASDTNAWHAQLLAQSFSMDLDTLDQPAAPAEAKEEEPGEERQKKPTTGKHVDRDFHQQLRDRLDNRQDLGEAMADTVRLGEGPHWKQRYYFEKFKVKQDDLVDFLQRIRKAYIEGLCWVLVYYYQGCQSWTWFYPYHYAPFASDLIGCASLKCGDLNYFQHGTPFVPFQQLMSVLPPSSSEEAGIPASMIELMKQPFSPLIDFYPVDFGLDLNGKRFTWQAVVLLPFIDEPRLVRVLAPLIKRITPFEKIRNRRGTELVFGHKSDKSLFHAVQLAQAAFEAGHAGLKQTVRGDKYLFGYLEGWASGGANRQVISPIEGLPDVEESHVVSAQFQDPEVVPHSSKLLPGIQEQALVVNAADMDESSRMKGFGGEPAKRMIMQALGKDPEKRTRYRDVQQRPQRAAEASRPQDVQQQQAAKRSQAARQEQQAQKRPAPAAARQPAPQMAAAVVEEDAAGQWGEGPFEYEEDESEFTAAPAPPAGTKVIRVHASGERNPPKKPAPKACAPVKKKAGSARAAPY